MPTLLFNGELSAPGSRIQLTCSTWEGDNTILSLQAGRSLVGAWGGESAGVASRQQLMNSRNQGQASRTWCPIPRYQGHPYR
jgi:hypothetical protein